MSASLIEFLYRISNRISSTRLKVWTVQGDSRSEPNLTGWLVTVQRLSWFLFVYFGVFRSVVPRSGLVTRNWTATELILLRIQYIRWRDLDRKNGTNIMELIETRRGGKSLVLDNHRYVVNRHHNETTSWDCHKKKCKCRVITSKDITTVIRTVNSHDHPPLTQRELDILRVRQTVKRKADQRLLEPPSKIVCRLVLYFP